MALVVEDGTGLAAADSYLSLTNIKLYWTNRGVDLAASYADAVLEAKAREAFLYINTIGRYKGVQLVDGQAGEFPREGLTDWNARTVTGLPKRVKDAFAELTRTALTESLYVDLDRGGKISAESVGPISVSYAFDAPAGKTFRAAMALLAPYVRDVSEQFAPFIGGVAGDATSIPLFSVGMHDNGDVDG